MQPETDVRLEALERQLRYLKFALLGLALLCLGFLLAHRFAAPAPTLEVERLALVDERGRIRAELSLDENRAPRLIFLDGRGQSRVGLGMTEEGLTGLGLFGKDGEVRATLSLQTDGSPFLLLRDAEGSALTLLDDRPSLTLNAQGSRRVELDTWPDGLPRLRLTDGQGKLLFEAP